jgi:hypothetical protein
MEESPPIFMWSAALVIENKDRLLEAWHDAFGG